MRSSIYEGVVLHRRLATSQTGGVAHDFAHHVTMALVFLDEIDELFAVHPLWSTQRWRPVRFSRTDYLGDPTVPLDDAVRAAVYDQLGRRPTGPVAMLANLRTWGWLFNPLSVYYCYDEDGVEVDAIVLEVTSTPWHERHVYVIDGADRRSRFAKEMHVSPFMGMDLDYVLNWTAPGERLRLHLGNRHESTHVFDASIDLERRDATRRSLGDMVWRHPLQTYSVSANIYHQAIHLFVKGAPFLPRARSTASSDTVTTVRSRRP
jgi:DUF1365 family protein